MCIWFNLNNKKKTVSVAQKDWKVHEHLLKTEQKPSVQCPRFKSLKQKSNQEKIFTVQLLLHMKLIAMVKICITCFEDCM